MSAARDEQADAREFGLPPYLDEVVSGVEKPRSRAAMSTAPRAAVLFDPGSSLGPELLLPPTHEVDSWVLHHELGQRSFPASTLRERSYPLPVARKWVVEGRKDGELVNRLEVVASAGGAFFFSLEDGQPITSGSCANSELVALVPPETKLSVDGRVLGDGDRCASWLANGRPIRQ